MENLKSVLLGLALCTLMVAAQVSRADSRSAAAATGISSYLAPRAYLQMPAQIDGPLPLLLSQTGAFLDTARLVPNPSLIPYDIIVPFWSDGAAKTR